MVSVAFIGQALSSRIQRRGDVAVPIIMINHNLTLRLLTLTCDELAD